MPSDGSSMSFCVKPETDPRHPCKCSYHWNTADSCINNRVVHGLSEEVECIDRRDYVIDLSRDLIVGGTFYRDAGRIWANISVEGEVEAISAFLIDDMLLNLVDVYPRHLLYLSENLSEGEWMRQYRIHIADYLSNESHNDTGYYHFTEYDLIDAPFLPMMRGDLVIDRLNEDGEKIEAGIIVDEGAYSNLTLSPVILSRRLSAKDHGFCDIIEQCPKDMICLDEGCRNLSDLVDERIKLVDVLTEINRSEDEQELEPKQFNLDFSVVIAFLGILFLLSTVFVVLGGRRNIDAVIEKMMEVFR
jgi:hypothetical protein